MQQKSQNTYTINTVKNAMRILRLFTKEQHEWNLSDISRNLGLNISHTKRLVKTLEEQNYLQRNSKTKKYRLGLSILRLCGIITTTMEVHREAKPVLEELVVKYGETVHLGVLEGTDIVYLEKMDGTHPIRLFSHIGKRNPAYCTGCGKVMLAFQEEATLERIIQEMEETGFYAYGPNTVTSSKELMFQLERIRRQGYAVSVDEFHEGVVSIGAPVYDYTGEVIAAISITAPNERISSQDIPYFTQQIVHASKIISEKLGYYFFNQGGSHFYD